MQPISPCEPFYARDDKGCVPSQDPVDKYARCTIRDASNVKIIDGNDSLEGKLLAAKNSASGIADMKTHFEHSVQSVNDRCVILDISARCFELATKGEHAVAPRTSCGIIVPDPTPSATAPSPIITTQPSGASAPKSIDPSGTCKPGTARSIVAPSATSDQICSKHDAGPGAALTFAEALRKDAKMCVPYSASGIQCCCVLR